MTFVLATGCVDEPPTVARCAEGTVAQEGDGTFVQFRFTAADDLRDSSAAERRSRVGTIHWALYAEGEVDLFGPGDDESEYGGRLSGVDFSRSSPPPAYLTEPVDVDPGAYHVLAFLDQNGTEAAEDGEWVTFPSEAVRVPAGTCTRIEAELNFER
jgi:hypothetical protein